MENRKEVEFRDGKRWIPAHLADMMATLNTHTLTYEEAVEKANWKLASDHINTAADSFIKGHFRGGS